MTNVVRWRRTSKELAPTFVGQRVQDLSNTDDASLQEILESTFSHPIIYCIASSRPLNVPRVSRSTICRFAPAPNLSYIEWAGVDFHLQKSDSVGQLQSSVNKQVHIVYCGTRTDKSIGTDSIC